MSGLFYFEKLDGKFAVNFKTTFSFKNSRETELWKLKKKEYKKFKVGFILNKIDAYRQTFL